MQRFTQTLEFPDLKPHQWTTLTVGLRFARVTSEAREQPSMVGLT